MTNLFKKEREWQRGKVATKIEVDDDGTVNVRYHNTVILKKSNDGNVMCTNVTMNGM